jgi:cytochrome c553
MSPIRALTVAILVLAALPLKAQETAGPGPSEIKPDHLAYFEKHIRPALVTHCYECHSTGANRVRGGLLLDTSQATLLGGESGKPGVTPGNPGASTIYTAITWMDPDMQMPPKNKLPDSVIDHFKTWIEMGAPDPRDGAVPNADGGRRQIDMEEGRKHWSFQPPVKHPLPEVKAADWAGNPIDHFLLAAMEKAGLKPVGDADRATLIRRVSYDLTGLPPTPEQVEAFLADKSPGALENMIDQYLDSPRFGERWARHWLDVARYADSNGKETNLVYPHAWRYRDFVIQAFNTDKPYDQFLREQIAGDLLRASNERDQAEKIIATGFLALGPKGLNERDRRQFQMDLVDEQIDVLSQSMLGLTIACARCHDHKFDPVTQADYYALAGIFLSTETLYGTQAAVQNAHPSTLIELPRTAAQPSAVARVSERDLRTMRERMEEAERQARELEREVVSARASGRPDNPALSFVRVRAARERTAMERADLELFYEDGTPRALAMGALDRRTPVNSPLLVRGDPAQPADIIHRGLVEVLCAPDEPRAIAEGSGRLDLAFWIASPENPLTARVMANRVWLKLMGEGIVPTPDNFGVMGLPPSHPELLDHLAVSFMENGWSVKKLIREILLSRAYRLASTHDTRNYEIDPDNKLRWRMDQRRLDAEAIHDAMLAVAGVLDVYPVTGSPAARITEDRRGMLRLLAEMNENPPNSRAIFQSVIRDFVPDFLTLFDFPDASLVSGQREATNVPSQSLFLMNNARVLKLADEFARRVGSHPGSPTERLEHAWELALSRKPTRQELAAFRTFWMTFPAKVDTGSRKNTREDREKAEKLALTAFCQALFASAEFRYLN